MVLVRRRRPDTSGGVGRTTGRRGPRMSVTNGMHRRCRASSARGEARANLGFPPRAVGPLPRPTVGITEPRLLSGDVTDEVTTAADVGLSLDLRITFAHNGIGIQPVDEQECE